MATVSSETDIVLCTTVLGFDYVSSYCGHLCGFVYSYKGPVHFYYDHYSLLATSESWPS